MNDLVAVRHMKLMKLNVLSIKTTARLTLAIRQFAIGESRSLLAKKKQDPSPIWLNLFFFLGLPLVLCILFEDIRVLGLFTGIQ